MKPFFVAAALAFAAAPCLAEGPVPAGAVDPAALRQAVQRAGGFLGLKLGGDGRLRWERINPRTGVPFASVLPPAAADRIGRFLVKLPADAPEAALADALVSYLSPRLKPADPGFAEFLTPSGDGKYKLTALGRSALMDVLTAEDGTLVGDAQPQSVPGSNRLIGPTLGLDRRFPGDGGGSLAAVSAALADARAFDGGARHQVAAFDWSGLAREMRATGLKGVRPSVLEGYTVDREAGTVRVLVAAGRSVKTDRLKVAGDRDAAAVLKEAGLDARLFAKHGAKVVRAVDNLIAVDVPLPQAAELGRSLGRKGLSSAPARLFRRLQVSAAAAARGPASGLLGGQFLPFPLKAVAGALASASGEPLQAKASRQGPEEKAQPLNLDSASRLRVDALRKAGMDGEGAVVGIIDSGLDEKHPDLAGRVADYMDFTDEGKADPIGHGTHVAGTVAGSGAASDGKIQGLAPKSKLVVAKVFGTKGEASEDVILAAMKWMTTTKERPDVVNMSLGGPGEPNVDPLGSMANRMMVKDNILLVAAAGNEGPGAGTVGAPGNARYVLTVTGVNKSGEFPFFPSRGPVGGDLDGYAKPDIAAVAGDVNLPSTGLWAEFIASGRSGMAGLKSLPAEPSCIYGPGVVSTRSSDDPDTACAVAGNPSYRFMTGTSMAAPMVAAVGADVIGFLKGKGASARAVEVKAALLETATDLGKAREMQGAGLMNGEAIARTVAERVEQGLPIGNIAYALALRLTTQDRQLLAKQSRYRETALGLLDTKTGHLVNTDRELDAAVKFIRQNAPPPPPPPKPVSDALVAEHRSSEKPVFRPFPAPSARARR